MDPENSLLMRARMNQNVAEEILDTSILGRGTVTFVFPRRRGLLGHVLLQRQKRVLRVHKRFPTFRTSRCRYPEGCSMHSESQFINILCSSVKLMSADMRVKVTEPPCRRVASLLPSSSVQTAKMQDFAGFSSPLSPLARPLARWVTRTWIAAKSGRVKGDITPRNGQTMSMCDVALTVQGILIFKRGPS